MTQVEPNGHATLKDEAEKWRLHSNKWKWRCGTQRYEIERLEKEKREIAANLARAEDECAVLATGLLEAKLKIANQADQLTTLNKVVARRNRGRANMRLRMAELKDSVESLDKPAKRETRKASGENEWVEYEQA